MGSVELRLEGYAIATGFEGPAYAKGGKSAGCSDAPKGRLCVSGGERGMAEAAWARRIPVSVQQAVLQELRKRSS